MNNTTKNQIVDAFFTSDDMKEYLKTQNLSDADIFDIIAGSLTCLDCKLEWLKRAFPQEENDRTISYRNKAIEDLEVAIDELNLKTGEIFTLTENWYDEDILSEKKSGFKPYTRLSSVLKYINSETIEVLKDLGAHEELLDTCSWYTLDKWALNEGGAEYENVYTYYLVGSAVVYFRNNRVHLSENFFRGVTELNLPIPFMQGDIVSVDCKPFYPEFPALILTVGDNSDCCSVQGMKMDRNGTWEVGALKHNSFIDSFQIPMVSPLYSLSKNTKKISENMDLIPRIAIELKYESARGGDKQ